MLAIFHFILLLMVCSGLFSEDMLSLDEKLTYFPIVTPIRRLINIVIKFRILDISPIKYLLKHNNVTNVIHNVSRR